MCEHLHAADVSVSPVACGDRHCPARCRCGHDLDEPPQLGSLALELGRTAFHLQLRVLCEEDVGAALAVNSAVNSAVACRAASTPSAEQVVEEDGHGLDVELEVGFDPRWHTVCGRADREGDNVQVLKAPVTTREEDARLLATVREGVDDRHVAVEQEALMIENRPPHAGRQKWQRPAARAVQDA